MLEALAISSSDDVVEFAPGLGATAKLTLQHVPNSYTAIERDEVAARQVRNFLSAPQHRCLVGNAQTTGLPAQSASVVYGEAMLTMQPPATQDQIVGEAARLLRSGGRYGIHELALVPDGLPEPVRSEITRAFGQTIHHLVQPLTAAEWRELLERNGMVVRTSLTAPMHLLEPVRLVRDEGFFGATRFVLNVIRHPEAKARVMELRRLFRSYRDHVSAVALVAVKR
jgi:ubiquinone/menaquinone biosynthesis C-methylase UbiE